NAYVTGSSSGGRPPDAFPPAPSGSKLGIQPNHGGQDVMIAKIAAQNLVTLALPDAAVAGTKITGTVTLDVAAPPGGEPIQISSGDRALATPDVESVTIPEGQQSATFTITTAK